MGLFGSIVGGVFKIELSVKHGDKRRKPTEFAETRVA